MIWFSKLLINLLWLPDHPRWSDLAGIRFAPLPFCIQTPATTLPRILQTLSLQHLLPESTSLQNSR